MRSLFYGILFCWILTTAQASDMKSVVTQTLSQAEKYKNDSYTSMKNFKPENTFNHYSSNPSQIQYYKGATDVTADSMNQTAFNAISSTENGNTVMNSINQHPKFVINKSNPDIQHSLLLQSEADHIVHGVISQYTDCKPKQDCHIQYTTKLCSESSLNPHPTCRKNRIISARLPDNAIQTIAITLDASPKNKILQTVVATLDLLNSKVISVNGKITHFAVLPSLQSIPCEGLEISFLGSQSNDKKYPVKIEVIEPPTCNNHFQIKLKLASDQWFMSRAMNVTLTYRFVAKLSPLVQESWTNNCNYLEQLHQQGICQLTKPDVCVAGSSTHLINGLPITRDCWATQSTYDCNAGKAANNCSPFQAQGCEQIGSACQDKVGNLCTVYQQTYRCPINTCTNTTTISCGDGKDYCLDGNCVDHDYKPSADFAKSMSALCAVQDASKTFDPNGNFIFKGHVQQCRNEAGDFNNCCQQKGWGQDLKLAHCNAEEKSLGPNREHGLTVYVGNFCSSYFPWPLDHVCREHKKSYCVFGSKLARIIQQQGKSKQLHLGFGNPEHPHCDGISPQQLQKIDLSKIDFHDFYTDLDSKMKKPNLNQVKQLVQQHIEQYRASGQSND